MKPDYEKIREKFKADWLYSGNLFADLVKRAEKLEAVLEAAKNYASVARCTKKPSASAIENQWNSLSELEQAIKEVGE